MDTYDRWAISGALLLFCVLFCILSYHVTQTEKTLEGFKHRMDVMENRRQPVEKTIIRFVMPEEVQSLKRFEREVGRNQSLPSRHMALPRVGKLGMKG
jgi:hypothetical protein